MNSRSKRQQRLLLAFAVGVASLALTLNVAAQVQTETITFAGQPTTTVQVDRAKVVLVDGNDLVVKTEDGRLVHFANVPESTRATVEGQQLGIHDLKPGMILARTIETTTTPLTVLTVKRVTGTVFYVNPPTSVILTLEDGTNQEFKIPQGQKFNINGQMTDAWGLKPGMKISATKLIEAPEEVIEQEKQITGTMPPPEPELPILVVLLVPEAPAPAPAPQETAAVAPLALPKTATQLPPIGILGAFALMSGLGLRARRLRAARVRS
jgi:hypothetical protein